MKMLARTVGQSGDYFVQFSKRIWLVPTQNHSRCLCTGTGKTPITNNNSEKDAAIEAYKDTYKKIQELDFWTSAKIVFTAPPTRKKFGFDFHLVQFFFACMPSLAVYLVAQYARYDMKKMEAELEVKKKSEEAKAKEMEAKAAEEREKEAANDPRLLEVKARLDKLEETVKEIAVGSGIERKDGAKGKGPLTTDSKSSQASPEASSSEAKESSSKDSTAGAPPI